MFKPKHTVPAFFVHTLWPTTKRVFVVSVLSLLLLPLFFLTRGGTGVPHAYAATSDNLNFQARLETTAGAIAPDGYYNIQFKLYDADSGGTLLWTETYYDSNGGTAGNDNRVRVANGYVTVNLGSQTTFPSNMPWDQQLYLTMNVGGTTQTATPTWDGEMSPRLKLTAVPYAFNAKTASQIVSSSGANLATLSIAAPTSGNQTFTIQDQGAAGSYNILTQNQIQAGFIQNQNAAAQTTANFWISGNGRSDTAFQAPLFDTATAAALGIGTTNASSITIGATTVTTTVQGPFVANGSQFTNNGSTLLTGNTLSDFAASGAVGTAAATVDIYTTFVIPQTTAGRTLSLPAPTTGTAGRLAYVLNTGSSAFTMHGVSIQSGKAQTYIYDGSAWTATNIDGAGSGATFVGTIDSQTKSGDGAVLSGNGIYLQTADGSNPGLVSTGIQTFAGDKTFSGNVTINTGLTVSGANIDLNASSNFNTNINTGTSTGAVNIGNGAAGNISIQSGGTIGLTGTTTVLGTTTINGSGSAATTISTGTGNTTIGNTTGTTSITGSTNTVAGTTNINTTGTSTTTIGSATAGAVSITSNAASSFTTNTGALTLTSAAAATWGTNAGALTLQGAGGTTVTSTAGATSGDTTISTGNASAGASGNIAIDTGTATTTAGTVSIGTTNASGVTIGRAATTTTIQGTLSITPQASSSTTLLCTNVGVLSTCDASVIAPTATNFIQNQNAIQQTTANFWISGTGRADTSILTPTLDTATAVALSIGTTNATSINLNQDTVLASGQTITITGGNTASRPASPTEGMVYYDTTTKQLLTYANGKWQADRSEAVLVAASDSSDGDKASADYVADGNTAAAGDGDQVEVNQALTAATGKKVVLLKGTYTIDASVSIPNNTTLSGIGQGTLITIPNSLNASLALVTNADTTTGTNVMTRDFKVDGNRANQSSGTTFGVSFENVGGGSGSSARTGAKVVNIEVTNTSSNAIDIYYSPFSIISNSIVRANNVGLAVEGSQGTIISGLRSQGNDTSGAWLYTSPNSTVTNSVFEANAVSGVFVSVSSDGSTLTSNTFYANNAGIAVSSSHNVISNNTIEQSNYGIELNIGASNNQISGNTLTDSGGLTNNNAVLDYGSANSITDNTITDSSCSTTCIALNLSGSGANLSANIFTGDGTYAATINDAGTDTVYAGQAMTQGGLDIRFKQANSTTAFNIQNANGVSVMNVDTTNGELEVGTYNGGTNPVAGKIVFATTANANTVTLSSATQTTGSFTLSIPDLTANADVCTSLNNCGSLTATSGIQNQNASAQTANFWISGTGRADTSILTPTLDTATATALNIGTTNATSINLNQDTTVASGKNLTVTSGTTSLTGTTNINTSGSATTTIGNASATNAIAGTTSVLGTTDINTTGTAATSIGSATGGAVSIAANAASSFTTNTGALTLTSAAAATWGTNAGALTLQGAGGTTVTSTAGATSGDTTISTGNASAGASGNIAIDTGTATTTAGTVSIGTTNASGVTIGRAATTTTIQGTLSITPQASSSTTLLCTNGGVLSTCDASVIAPTATNFIQNQNAIQQTTANFWISGTGRADTSILTPTLDTATATTLNIGTTNATSVNINQSTVLASGKTITITGDTRTNITAIGSPTEGMMTYDTTNKQLLVYSNGKWQADRHEAILVAANNSTQAEKDAADYVATGTGDESTINTALIAADPAGSGRKTGKVYLFAGTYNLTAAISVPNNTTLAGSGNATVITAPSSQNGSYNMISAASTTVIRDLKVDGNKAGQTSGTMQGVYLASNSMVSGVTITNIYGATGSGIKISGKNNTVSGNTLTNNSYAGVYDFGGSTNGLNIITDNTVTGNAYGISVIAPSDIISNNVVSGGTAGILISIYSKNIVTNNTVESNTYGVYLISGASNSIVKLNSINNNGDGTSTNNGVYLSAADSNTITDNNITDTSCTASCYAINISNAGSDTNYLGDNTFTGDGTYAATINDAGTGTIYAGQAMTQGGLDIRFKQANSTTAFNIQNANGISVMNVDTTNGELEVGTYNGGTNPVAGKIVIATTANANTVTIASATQTGAYTLTIPALAGNATICTDNSTTACNNFIQNQTGTTQTAGFKINGAGTLGGLLTATAGATVSGAVINLNVSSNFAVNVGTGTTTAAVSIGNSANTTNLASRTINIGTVGATNVIQGVAQTTSNTTGDQLTIKGSAGLGSGNGGTLLLSGGDAGASGKMGLVSLNPTAFASSAVQSYGTGGVNNLTAGYVDTYSTIPATATISGVIMSIPDPVLNTTVGRILYVSATTTSQDFTLRLNASRTAIDINLKKNNTATLIWNGTDWTAAGASSATDLQAAYNNTQTNAGGAEIVLNSANQGAGVTIRNSGTPITGALFEVQSSIAANLFSVNNNTTEYASNGGIESGTTDWAGISTSPTQNSTLANVASGLYSLSVPITANNQGVKNTLVSTLSASTTYVVSFAVKTSAAGPYTFNTYYSVDGTANSVNCNNTLPGSGYTLTNNFSVTSNWTKISCFITTPASGMTASNAIRIYETNMGGSGTFYVDNLSVISNAAGTTPANVQIGGGATGGQPTLFTLDQFAGPPMTTDNPAYYGSMYYDTTKNAIQCYQQSSGVGTWGACGSAPDDIISMTPEYTGAVLNGTGVGTMTADFCANQTSVLTVGTLCASGEARNYYKWTSPQATPQTYGIYVTYRLPSTFKSFKSGTMSLTGLVDSTSNAAVKYAVFRKASAGTIYQCSADTTNIGTANTWTSISPTTDITSSSCAAGGANPFAAGDTMIIRITVSAQSNANAYVENLTFQYSNK